MSYMTFSQTHLLKLKEFAAEAEAQLASDPSNWMLAAIAKNQRAAFEEAELAMLVEEGANHAQALEWRISGARLSRGQIPLGLLAKLSDPLNKLLLRAAYFARNQEEPTQGTGEAFNTEMNLKLAAISEGSARLFIVGNTIPDMTGSAPLAAGVDRLFSSLHAANDNVGFYDSIADLGEMASESLHEAMKALEGEECSLEMRWYSNGNFRSETLRFDQVVQVRALLDITKDPVIEEQRIVGLITLLASTGRIQVLQETGEKVSIRFRPKTQADYVAKLRLGQAIDLNTSAKVLRDPATGQETRQYRLKSDQAP